MKLCPTLTTGLSSQYMINSIFKVTKALLNFVQLHDIFDQFHHKYTVRDVNWLFLQNFVENPCWYIVNILFNNNIIYIQHVLMLSSK